MSVQYVRYQPPSSKQQQEQERQRQQREAERKQRERIAATAKFIGINAILGIPLVLIFGFTIPIWSLAISTIGFAISVYAVEKNEKISKWRSIFYNLIIFATTNTIGVLLMGGGGILAVFQSLAIAGVVTTIFLLISFTRRILLLLVTNKWGQWVGYAFSITVITTIASAVFAFDPPYTPQITSTLQTDLQTLSSTFSETNGRMTNSLVIHPLVIDGRAYIYAMKNGKGQTLSIPTKAYTSYYDRIVALLTRSPLNADALLASKSGVVREVLASNNLFADNDPPIVVVDGNMQAVNFNSEFPTSIVFRSVSTDVALIQQNINRLIDAPAISPINTRIVNATPADEKGLSNLNIEGKWSDWSGIHAQWQSIIAKHGYAEQAGKTPSDVLNAIASGSNVMIVVAHSDGTQIFFPDGSSLKVQDFEAYREQIQKNNPLIILFSCETAKINGVDSYAKSLIDLGAKAVVAPTTQIGAVSSSSLLDGFLQNSESGINIIDALSKAAKDSNILDLQNWIGFVEPVIRFE